MVKPDWSALVSEARGRSHNSALCIGLSWSWHPHCSHAFSPAQIHQHWTGKRYSVRLYDVQYRIMLRYGGYRRGGRNGGGRHGDSEQRCAARRPSGFDKAGTRPTQFQSAMSLSPRLSSHRLIVLACCLYKSTASWRHDVVSCALGDPPALWRSLDCYRRIGLVRVASPSYKVWSLRQWQSHKLYHITTQHRFKPTVLTVAIMLQCCVCRLYEMYCG